MSENKDNTGDLSMVSKDYISKQGVTPTTFESSSQTPQSGSNNLILMLKTFDEFADYIINSEYRKSFEKVVKDEDGKQVKIVEKGDIIACLALGHELGIPPMSSVALGKQLNSKSYFSVIRGRELGLNPVTSISKIYNIETSNGSIVSLAVDVISKIIHESGTSIEYVLDFKYVPTYKNVADGSYIGHYYQIYSLDGKLDDMYFIYDKTTTKDKLEEAVNDNKIIIQKSGYTHVTAARMIRPKIGFDKIFFYSLQQATDAGLYKGFHSSNIDEKGKPIYVAGRSNWNSHPETMLRNRVTSIGGRIAVADKLQGSYEHSEAMEILNINNEKDLIKVL